MLTAGGAEEDILRVSVVLHPPLVNLIDDSPTPGGDKLQDQLDIPIPKTAAKEGGKSGSSPAVDVDDESELDTVAFGDEDEVGFGP